MPRYMVEQEFPDGLEIPLDIEGAEFCEAVVAQYADCGVTWIHSYVSEDRRIVFCLCDGPDPDSIRRAGRSTNLPVGRITRVFTLDPWGYR